MTQSRTPRDARDPFIPLTIAQSVFGFRTLKQIISYLGKSPDGAVRQVRQGRRRFVSVLDLARELEARPRPPERRGEAYWW